jgi:hypothetical protein
MNRLLTCCVLALLGLAIFAQPTRADWNPGDPYKMMYPLLPDLTPTGMDVLASPQLPTVGNGFKIVADDFLCTETGPITDIHIWGSWLNNILPQGDANNVQFKLSIHSDIPAPPTGGYSQPGAELWTAVLPPGAFTARPYATGSELFYDPNLAQIIGEDNVIWQYNFTHLPNPLIQQRGTIYWLDVQAQPLAPDALFGWKTTNPIDPRTPHFMDDAVFADTDAFAGPLITPWKPMVYPAGHPYAGQSFDQAFVITTIPEPGTLALLAAGAIGLLGYVWRKRK